MKLENFSLLYPDGKTRQDHLAGVNVPDIDMYTLQELGMLEFFNPKSAPAAEHFTTDPAVIAYRNQTFSDMLNNPTLADTLHRLVPVLQDITELRRLETDSGEDDTASYLSSMTEIELYITCVDILHKGMTEVRDNLRGTAFKRLCDCVTELAESDYYRELNQKLQELTRRVREIRSVTIGVNLDAQLRPAQAGVLDDTQGVGKVGHVKGVLAQVFGVAVAHQAPAVDVTHAGKHGVKVDLCHVGRLLGELCYYSTFFAAG